MLYLKTQKFSLITSQSYNGITITIVMIMVINQLSMGVWLFPGLLN